MQFWDAGKPAAPWKWRKQVAAEVSSSAEGESCTPEVGKAGYLRGELPCGRGAMHPGNVEKQVISEVSSPVEGKPCTPEMEKTGYFRGE